MKTVGKWNPSCYKAMQIYLEGAVPLQQPTTQPGGWPQMDRKEEADPPAVVLIKLSKTSV
jgi:hypothetical protein